MWTPSSPGSLLGQGQFYWVHDSVMLSKTLALAILSSAILSMSVLFSDLLPHDLQRASRTSTLSSNNDQIQKSVWTTALGPFKSNRNFYQKFPLFTFTFHQQRSTLCLYLNKTLPRKRNYQDCFNLIPICPPEGLMKIPRLITEQYWGSLGCWAGNPHCLPWACITQDFNKS